MTKTVVAEYPVRSRSHPDQEPYLVKRYDDGSFSCPCPRWVYKNHGRDPERWCHHVEFVKAELEVEAQAEALRLPSPTIERRVRPPRTKPVDEDLYIDARIKTLGL